MNKLVNVVCEWNEQINVSGEWNNDLIITSKKTHSGLTYSWNYETCVKVHWTNQWQIWINQFGEWNQKIWIIGMITAANRLCRVNCSVVYRCWVYRRSGLGAKLVVTACSSLSCLHSAHFCRKYFTYVVTSSIWLPWPRNAVPHHWESSECLWITFPSVVLQNQD